MKSIIVGALLMAILLILVDFTRRKKLQILWWQWLITILGFIYTGFVLQMIISFLSEGSPQAALIMGLIFGFIAVIWGVLLGRFVFLTKKSK